MTKYKIKAHPTKYGGIEFRSRLEATWAAMFDLMNWRWEYEPFDLEGWVPDFLIHGEYRDLLVEVKPTQEMISEVFPRVLAAAPGKCVLFVENGPPGKNDGGLTCGELGWVASPYNRTRFKGKIIPSVWLRNNPKRDQWDAHIDGERYIGFNTGDTLGVPDGIGPNDWGGTNSYWDEYTDLRPLWREATNITRWKPA